MKIHYGWVMVAVGVLMTCEGRCATVACRVERNRPTHTSLRRHKQTVRSRAEALGGVH